MSVESTDKITCNTLFQPLFIVSVVHRKLFGSHILNRLLNQPNHVLAFQIVVFFESHVLSFDFAEDILDRVQLRSISWKKANWPV
jgi:hypothetical protein